MARYEDPLPPSKAQRCRSCRSCGASIIWLKTMAGKNMPVDYDSVHSLETTFNPKGGHVSHFSTCPNASRHRKRK